MMDLFRTTLIARNVSDELFAAHRTQAETRAYHLDYADREFRLLAHRMGYRVEREEKVEPASPLSMETAAALLGYPGANR